MTKKANTLNHLALIMDGNGRWAEHQSVARVVGHRKGAETLKKIVEACLKKQIPYLTVYAFSSENWGRPPQEIRHLLHLFEHYMVQEESELLEKGIRFKVIGHKEGLPSKLKTQIQHLEDLSAKNTALTLQVAFNYGGRQEIVQAIKRISEAQAAGRIKNDAITENLVEEYLYAPNVPHPDLLIRTGGEQRLSNYLLWQLAYTELFFSEKFWPDFDMDDLDKAIASFHHRERRFGKAA